MATGFGLSLMTFTPNTTARSGDVNSNFQALAQAGNYAFSTLQIDPALTPDSTFRGMRMVTSTDFGILNNTNNNWFRIASGMTGASRIVFTDLSNNAHIGFWSDGSYDYLDCFDAYFRLRLGGTVNTLRVANGNSFTIGSSSYGFIASANGVFGQGSTNADIAEPLLTTQEVRPGMAVCIIDHDTVAPCTHVACRVAKIASTAPVMLLAPRIENDEDMTPLSGHESAMPIVIGGVAPVLMEPGTSVKLRDRITTSGNTGLCKVARDEEYALGDIIKIEKGIVYAWVRY